ncbi:MAG: hypothetical protein F6J93_20930 [Oscillatoria sp. SIO1A7]|nr:hypothetical protein [Oscillatoria sp. SIO1A7]
MPPTDLFKKEGEHFNFVPCRLTPKGAATQTKPLRANLYKIEMLPKEDYKKHTLKKEGRGDGTGMAHPLSKLSKGVRGMALDNLEDMLH